MNSKDDIPDIVKSDLNTAIEEAVRLYQEENTGRKHFTRKRKLDMETIRQYRTK